MDGDLYDKYGLDAEKLKRTPCHQIFNFGSSKYLATEIIEIPINMKDKQGEVASYVAPTYILNSKTPFLLGKKQMKDWKALINIGDDELVLETYEKEHSA